MTAGDVDAFMATMVTPSRPVPIGRAVALVREWVRSLPAQKSGLSARGTSESLLL